jgi:hypothetical protein
LLVTQEECCWPGASQLSFDVRQRPSYHDTQRAPRDWAEDRALSCQRENWCGRHGRGLSRAGHTPGPRRSPVYVQPFPGPGGKWQISTNGGTVPVWAQNGRELFYMSSGKLMSVGVTTQPTFSASTPRIVADIPPFLMGRLSNGVYDVSPDGQRFLFVKANVENASRRSARCIELDRRTQATRGRAQSAVTESRVDHSRDLLFTSKSPISHAIHSSSNDLVDTRCATAIVDGLTANLTLQD